MLKLDNMKPLDISFVEFKIEDSQELVSFFISETWSFHSNPNPSAEAISKSIENGSFINTDIKTFWIAFNNEKIGVIKLFDLEDEIPLFDIRIKAKYRGKGVGEYSLKWLIKYVFETLNYKKLEGTTRQDNISMSKTFLKCGFVKEGHHRKSWPDETGFYYDAIGYGILKEEWIENKSTPVNWFDEKF